MLIFLFRVLVMVWWYISLVKVMDMLLWMFLLLFRCFGLIVNENGLLLVGGVVFMYLKYLFIFFFN